MKSLIQKLADALKTLKKTIVTAESITAGRFAALLTSIPGASAYFLGGYTTYSNDAKMKMIGVSSSSLDIYGAVSEQVSREMAMGAIQGLDADIAISFTGNAGPDPMEDKPVGLTYIAIYIRKGEEYIVETFAYMSEKIGREEIIDDTMMFACEKLIDMLSIS